ncbi:DUF2800 domain-containing protein [Rhizobium nepotum]|uniref:DUF2800 domain-containing protein n=1 Tax=Rhizobium nepotum TaxID=1035271 RepID=UPI003CEC1ECC
MTGHARNSPSDSKRWITCPGALNRCKKLGLDKDDGRVNTAADEGTAAHLIREMCLEIGLDAHDFVGTPVEVNGVIYMCDEDMADALQPGIDRIREFPGRMIIESRVDITHIVGLNEDGNPQRGTLDCAVIPEPDDGDEAVQSDLKYGKGIPVAAVGNTQQIIYFDALWEKIKDTHSHVKRVRIIIDQPRNGRGGGEWVISIDELREKAAEIRERAKLTFDPNAPCTPSIEGCTWCPAAKVEGACPEYEAWNLEFCGIEFENLDDYDDFGIEVQSPDPEGLTTERKKAIYDHLPVIRKFLTRVEASVADDVRIGDGEKYGLKIIAGRRSNRKHADEEKSQAWLEKHGFDEDLIITKKLKTPAMLDKIVGKGKFPRDFVVGGEPTPSIVSIEDARPALLVTPDFENLDEEFEDFDD